MPNISEARREAARRNGAKSRGPVTPEGKAISARNNTTHGLAVRSTVLPWESQAAAVSLFATLTQQYKPATDAESDMVEMLAVHQWQQLRAFSIQQGLLKNAECKTEEAFRKEFTNADRDSRTAETFRHVATTDSAFRLALRYAAEARLAFSSKLKELERTQAARDTQPGPDPDPPQPPDTEPETDNQAEPKPATQTASDPGDSYPGTPRTALCPCQSGEKYKRCCGRQAPPALN